MSYKEILEQVRKLPKDDQEKLVHFILQQFVNEQVADDLLRLLKERLEPQVEKQIPVNEVDDAYHLLVANQFLEGYSEEDNMYNTL